ncbi:polymerase [Mycobacterium phage Konstantine]|uniref:Primase/polymerase n=1 Tax=Mycobacterium phage Konstantine TaxID=563121 RepID=B5U4X0_9CAUD|nr:polymerase [Mycobacterium phage Konstantine]ACI12510.1 hypothetical protein KONSTANTINE_95 [Mycobacterium phage Konstantine]
MGRKMKNCDNCETQYNEETTEDSMKIVVEYICDFTDTDRQGLARIRTQVYLCPECAKSDIHPNELADLSRESGEVLGWVL